MTLLHLPVFLGLLFNIQVASAPEQLSIESDAPIVNIPADAIAEDMEELGKMLEVHVDKEWIEISGNWVIEANKQIAISSAFALSPMGLRYRTMAFLTMQNVQTLNGFNGEVLFENEKENVLGSLALDLAVKQGTRYVVTFNVSSSEKRTFRVSTADHQYLEHSISKSGQMILALNPASDGFTRLLLESPAEGSWSFTGINIQTIN